MIELRFLKGNWEFGKFKLQYRFVEPVVVNSPYKAGGIITSTDWMDVPIAEEKPKVKTLAEKFRESLRTDEHINLDSTLERLAEIACKHYSVDAGAVTRP